MQNKAVQMTLKHQNQDNYGYSLTDTQRIHSGSTDKGTKNDVETLQNSFYEHD